MNHKNAKILLVEHYEAHVLIATLWLEMLGYDYDVARSTAEMMEKITMHSYAAILLDVHLQDGGGYEAATHIRAFEKAQAKAATPIIGMNADGLIGDRERCMDSGMDDYLLKPLQEQELHNKLIFYITPTEQAQAASTEDKSLQSMPHPQQDQRDAL